MNKSYKFCLNVVPNCGKKLISWEKHFNCWRRPFFCFCFFWSSPNFGEKNASIFSEDLFDFFGLHLISATELQNLQKRPPMENFTIYVGLLCTGHITCRIWYCPRRQSWPDFVWSLSLPRLAISFNHMHPLPQSIFLHLILYLLFPCLFQSSSTTTHFKFQSLHYHIFIFFLQNMIIPPYTVCFSHPI